MSKLHIRPPWIYGVHEAGRLKRSYLPLGPLLVNVAARKALASAGEVLRRYPYIVYVDSRDKASPMQVLKWFRYGFFPKRETLVVSRLHLREAAGQLREYERAGVDHLFFWPFNVLDLSQTAAVFYPYHTNTNQIVMKRNGPVHIFIGHGDSDKAGSINPLTRIYDHVLVAGHASTERLVAARVMSDHDATLGRAIRVGMPYVEPVQTSGLTPPPDAYVLYAPTWEGVERRQHYSSLERGYGTRLIKWLLGTTDRSVVFRPHPSTGRMLPAYARWAEDVVAAFANEPRFSVHADVGGSCPSAESLRRSGARARECTPSESILGAQIVVADVSSMASSAVYFGRPVIVIDKENLPNRSPESRVLDAHVSATLEYGTTPADSVAQLFTSADAWLAAHAAVLQARARCVSLESFLESVAPDQRVEHLVKHARRGPFVRS